MTTSNLSYKGFKVVGKALQNPMVKETIEFLASMDFCETCIDQKGYNLKIGGFKYDIKFLDRTIRVS